jgi:DNA-binding Lrp family transcriptional regulator
MNEKIKESLKALALEAEAISFSAIDAKTTKSRQECFSRIQALKGDIVRFYESIKQPS